jgi:Xaa-Pro aminopeptidase
VFRDFQRLCLEEGADWVPYLAGGAGPRGYADVISPATPVPLATGDVLMLDTGLVWDGYFCDYDRNFVVGAPGAEAAAAHARLIAATAAGLETARAGARASEVWQAMAEVCGARPGEGRLGHGLGMQLTEGLSLTSDDPTLLAPGMVITLEPVVELPGGTIMVHEENLVIRDGAPDMLSPLAGAEMPVI